MAALSTADALKRIPAPAWDIGERPTTAQAYITLPPYTCEKEDIVCQRSADGAYMSQAGRDRIRHATANSRREQQRRQGNGFCSSLHKATLDYRTVRFQLESPRAGSHGPTWCLPSQVQYPHTHPTLLSCSPHFRWTTWV